MLSKNNRLTKDKDFDRVFKRGKSSYDGLIGVRATTNKEKDSRFGILVSTKISKKAVERNKIKRQIREIIRLRLDAIKPGYDVIIISLANIIDKKYQVINDSIDKHFKKLNLYC